MSLLSKSQILTELIEKRINKLMAENMPIEEIKPNVLIYFKQYDSRTVFKTIESILEKKQKAPNPEKAELPKDEAPNTQNLRTDNPYYNKLNEQVKELDTLWQYDRNEHMLTDQELNELCIKYGVKKTYYYGKSYYGEAKVFLLSGKNGAIVWNDNGASYYYKDPQIAFSKAKGFVSRRYGLSRLMGFWNMAQIVKPLKCPYCQLLAPNLKTYYEHLDQIHTQLLKSLIDQYYGQ